MMAASRTVCTVAPEGVVPVQVVIIQFGSVMAKPSRASTSPERDQRGPAVDRDPLVGCLASAVDPPGEEHADDDRDVDHVATLQSLVPVERDGIEQMLQWRVGAQSQQHADRPDHVPGQAIPGRAAARATRGST